MFDHSIPELTECLISVQEWMNSVQLKLNPDKTEFIIIGDKHTGESLVPNFLLHSSKVLTPAEEVQHLGVTFDSEKGPQWPSG